MTLNKAQQTTTQVSPAMELVQMLFGYRVTQAIYVATKLGIADLLEGCPKSADDVAEAVGADPSALRRLLRALVNLGLVSEDEGGRFALTALGDPLRSGASDSVRATAIMYGDECYWQSWGNLLYSVKTGKPAIEHVFEKGLFQYFEQNSELAETFNEAMAEGAEQHSQNMLEAYNWSGINTVVDVGGGRGTLIGSILQAHRQMQGILIDLPRIIEEAPKHLKSKGVGARCQVIGGDFFEAVPEGGDIYILSRVINDWDDERAITILKNCRRSMTDDAKLIVVEQVIIAGNKHLSLLGDLNLLVTLSGRARPESEYRAIFDEAGFSLAKIIPIRVPFAIIEATPR